MPEREIELFNDSLERCTSRPGFLDRFYELFSASSQEVSDKFKQTDFKKQKRAVRTSLYMMMLAHERKPEADVHLDRIAQRHSRADLDIRPEFYDLWLASLLRAAREFDPLFSAETERAWRTLMRPGIEFMKSQY